MGEASGQERRATAAEIIRALDDDVAPESHAFWQYVFVVAELGDDAARQLVREVHAVEAAGGMATRDASRRRTPGGVFFTLAYERIGPKRSKSVRWRATRRAHEDLLRRFLGLVTLMSPARPQQPTAPVAAAPGRDQTSGRDGGHQQPPGRDAAGPAGKRPAGAVASTAKPARRPEADPVEVLVVRRRPATSS